MWVRTWPSDRGYLCLEAKIIYQEDVKGDSQVFFELMIRKLSGGLLVNSILNVLTQTVSDF